MKIINGHKVFWNSIVLKENDKFITLHNLGLLNGDIGTYLETYFLKKDFDIVKFEESGDELVEEMIGNLDEKTFKFLEAQNKDESEILDNIYDRPSDFILKNFIEKLKDKMNIHYSLEEDLNILGDLPEHSNSFNHLNIRDNIDKLDIKALLSNPEVDSYVKDCLNSIVSNEQIHNELEEANESFFKFKEVEKKRSLSEKIKEGAKKTGKITLVGSLLAGAALGFLAPHVKAAEIDHQQITSDAIVQQINQTVVKQATKENLSFKGIDSEGKEVTLDDIDGLTIFKGDGTIINYGNSDFKDKNSAISIFGIHKIKEKDVEGIKMDVFTFDKIKIEFEGKEIKIDRGSHNGLREDESKMIMNKGGKTYKVNKSMFDLHMEALGFSIIIGSIIIPPSFLVIKAVVESLVGASGTRRSYGSRTKRR